MNEKKYVEYCKENVVDNKEDIYAIIDLAADLILDNFDIDARDYPDMLITMFGVTFREIESKLLEKSRTGYEHFEIRVANRVELGFDNATSDDYEKNGGFMFYMKHCYFKTTDNEQDSDRFEDDTISLCNQWNSLNITSDSDLIKKIADGAYRKIRALDILIDSPECIIPIFVTIYECMVKYVKLKRADNKLFDYEINFASLFDITARESDNDVEDVITFRPAIEFKLDLKDDHSASSQYD